MSDWETVTPPTKPASTPDGWETVTPPVKYTSVIAPADKPSVVMGVRPAPKRTWLHDETGAYSTNEDVLSMAMEGGTGAVAGMAMPQALRLAGMVMQAIPYAPVKAAGAAAGEIGAGMEKIPKAELAKSGGLVGAASRAAIDYLKNKYDMSEHVANTLVMLASASPMGLNALWKVLPTRDITTAPNIVRETHSEGSPLMQRLRDKGEELMTQLQHSDAMKKLMGQFNVGEPGQDAMTISEMLKGVAGTRGKEIEVEGQNRMSALQGEAAQRAAKIQEEQMKEAARLKVLAGRDARVPSRMDKYAAASRVEKLGPDLTSSEQADLIRQEATPLVRHKEQALIDTGDHAYKAIEQEAAKQTAAGLEIQDTPGAKRAIEKINALVEPVKSGPGKGQRRVHEEDNKLVSALKNWRTRIKGSLVEEDAMVKAPTAMQIAEEKKRGITWYLKNQMGLTDKQIREGIVEGDTYPMDKVIQAMSQGGGKYASMAGVEPEAPGGWRDVIAQDFWETQKPGSGKMHYADDANWDIINWKQPPKGAKTEIRVGNWEAYSRLGRELNEIATMKEGSPGFSADMSKKAEEIAADVRAALNEFLPQSHAQGLHDYHQAAQDMKAFRGRFVGAVSDPRPNLPGAEQKVDAHRVADMVFAGRDPMRRFKTLINDDQGKFDQFGLGYMSSKMDGMSAEKAATWLKDQRELMQELSPAARLKVSAYLGDLKRFDAFKAASSTRGGQRVAEIGKIPERTSRMIEGGRGKEIGAELQKLPAEIQSQKAAMEKELIGDKTPVERFKELIETSKLNHSELKAAYEAAKSQPGGEAAFKRAVEDVIKRYNAKQIAEDFDFRIGNRLSAIGSHTPEEIKRLKGIVTEMDRLARAHIASPEDYRQLVQRAANSESMKGGVISAILGTIGGAALGSIGGPAGTIGGGITGGLVGKGAAALESVGIFGRQSAMVRNEKAIDDLIVQITNDKAWYEAAIAKPTEGNISKFLGMMAQLSRRPAAMQAGTALVTEMGHKEKQKANAK